MSANSIMTIHTYKYYGVWVFDDEKMGLDKEAFVGGAHTLLDKFDNGSGELTIVFSAMAFPGHQICLNLVETVENGEGGSTYFCEELKHTAWFCPALLKYMSPPPGVILCKINLGAVLKSHRSKCL